MPTFNDRCEKFELFEDLFQKSPKFQNQLTEDERINFLHSFLKGDASQTFRNFNSPTRESLGEIIAVFRSKYVNPQSMATAEHKFQKLAFNETQKVCWFSWWTSKPGQRRFRNSCSRHHWPIHVRENAITHRRINKSGCFWKMAPMNRLSYTSKRK